MENNRCAFFLGANSARGFVSFFGDAAREDFGRDTYFIKGGPGCGKATAIKKLASAADPTGEREEILCSSDPGSLDGIILRNGRAAFLDGTAPHTCDPSFPGMRGDYIALSAYKDIPALKEKYPAAVLLDAQSKDCYTRAYRLISSASLIDEHIRGIMTPHMPKERLIRRAKGIAAREISKKGGVGKVRKRFIDGVTPDGYMRLYETACALAGRIYDIYDSFGFSGIMLEVLIDAAVKNGHDLYACYDAVDTERLLHLIIPELSLAFVTSDRRRYFTGRPYRRIRLDSYLASPSLRQLRGTAKLLGRMSDSLLDRACGEIADAHALHDRIEALYRPHVDFDALDALVRTEAAAIVGVYGMERHAFGPKRP